MSRIRSLAVLSLSVATLLSSAAAQKRPKFSDWLPAQHLSRPINSEFNDQAPILSKDEKTLYFTSNRPGGSGDEDIWVSKRRTPNSPWEDPVNLGPTVNSSGIERLRSLTPDGKGLLFMSNRQGGSGSTDIWIIVRDNVNDDLDWSRPINLGSTINSPGSEIAAKYLFTNGGRTQKLFFTAERPDGFGGSDLFESEINGGFRAPANVFELNSPSVETCFTVSEDGLEIIFISNRPNTTGDLAYNELYSSTRESLGDLWSPPEKLGPQVNAADYQDVNPSLTIDGRTMMFASRRPGGIGAGTLDIYMTTRRRIAQ